MATKNYTCLATFQDSEHTINFTLTTNFIGFIPYILLLGIYYVARKTDNRQSHNPIHMNLIALSAVYIFGSLLLAVILLLLQSSEDILEKSEMLPSLYKVTACLFINGSSIIATIFYYLLFVSAFQRLFLLANAKLGTRVMTGRRLTSNIVILYFVGIISAFNKIMVENKTPWLEIMVNIITLLMYFLSTFMVQHIERRSVVLVHITVLAQTAPLAVFLAFLTIGKFYVLTSDQEFISSWTYQTLMASSISFATPLFLIIGSSPKRRIGVALITCQYEERTARGEIYTAERSPASVSNAAVSMIPQPRF